MRVLFLYQNIDSGAKLSTEAIIATLKKLYPDNEYISYKQPPQRFQGQFSYFKNLCWSIANYHSIIKKTEVDIIYSVMFTSALSYILSFKKSVPFVFHLHGDQKFGEFDARGKVSDFFRYPYFLFLNSFIVFLQTLALKTASKVIFVSPESRLEITKKYHLTKSISSIVIENGVDQKRFAPLSVRKKRLLKQTVIHTNSFLISYLGRMDEKKGVLNLIKSIPLIKHIQEEGIKILLAFPQPIDSFSIKLLRSVKEEAKKNGSIKQIILLENYSRLEEICQISDVVILPSIQEMFPLVMLESLSSGALFLSTRVGGVPTILEKISESLIMEDNQPETIAKHLQYLIRLNEASKKQLSIKSQAITKLYTWEKTSDRIQNVFSLLY